MRYGITEQSGDSGIRALKSKPAIGHFVTPQKLYVWIKSQEPANVTLFRKRVFPGRSYKSWDEADHPGLWGRALTTITTVLVRERQMEIWDNKKRKRYREGQVKEAVMQPQDKECLESPEARRDKERVFLRAFGRNVHVLALCDIKFLKKNTGHHFLYQPPSLG